ncbi:hypothetical protein QWJ34_21980 [Saccharibacillus sp. CPCC 101409]|uniref:hypothetical protein n=1 Tax=Saccharibacillus sp. CPCC 101409 TaxID=3058041 RepID=UPI0026734B0D|nr:hypothetical protein [Saccharibacillus sp. CPCC 101409]MDO3412449.1 hypothetical protein [Saccharibacillus sp. CPCC 101409]
MSFSRSDLGAQASWKGYSSQTLYIASRIVEDDATLEYYPEHLEDLLIKKDGVVAEVVQVKDLGSNMSLSSLASTSQSQKNEGFFQRVVSLKATETEPIIAKVVYFGALGEELENLINLKKEVVESVKKKLKDNHGLKVEEAEWLLDRLVFEKVDHTMLQEAVTKQVKNYIPTMSAPGLMQDLLIQYVSDLSRTQQFTSKSIWQEKVNQIGRNMASFDGFFREWGGSLITLSAIKTNKNYEELKEEYKQGVSTHPAHIRASLDFERLEFSEKIQSALSQSKAVIIKGVSGQGKTSLCYKYLIKEYSEELVFCIRQIQSHEQAANLVKAIIGLSSHTDHIIVYIDVAPGQTYWTWLIRELQVRGSNVPVLISIREEDFKQASLDESEVTFKAIELNLSEKEAAQIYKRQIENEPHIHFRNFEEAWQMFGGSGPLLEFMYLLNNNQTLEQRLKAQIQRLITEKVDDTWLELLLLVCYVGRVNGSVRLEKAKQEIHVSSAISALKRMSNEYLIRNSEDGTYIDSLHPVRAKILFEILQKEIGIEEKTVLLRSLVCVEDTQPQLLLVQYFTDHGIEADLISQIAAVEYADWTAYGVTLNTMLWLDVKQYVEENKATFDFTFDHNGSGWRMFVPMDVTGEIKPGRFAAEEWLEGETLNNVLDKKRLRSHLEQIKKSLKDTKLSYSNTDKWLDLSSAPTVLPVNETDWSNFGYSLFWSGLRKKTIPIQMFEDKILAAMSEGQLESRVDAALGLYQQSYMNAYSLSEEILRERLIEEYRVLSLEISEEEILCQFPPDYFYKSTEETHENFNHYSTMNMVKLLSRLYPNKNLVSVKLIGSELLKNLNVINYDNEKRILKEHWPDGWITQLNSRMLIRVNLDHRPDSWNLYLQDINVLRKQINEVLNQFINLVERFYKSKRWDFSAEKNFNSTLKVLQHALRKERLLPKAIIDGYGLSSEGFKENKEVLLSRINLSAQPDEAFRKHFSEMNSNMDNFFKQALEVLKLRREEREVSSNSSTLNIYEAAKEAFFMQNEFQNLFQAYTNEQYSTFASKELEDLLLTLNMWESVTNHRPTGNGLRYSAKEKLKRLSNKSEQAFQTFVNSMNPYIIVKDIEEGNAVHRFIIYTEPISETYTILDQYHLVFRELEKTWNVAKDFNYLRWQIETTFSGLTFIPLYNGLPIIGSFEIPLFRILGAFEVEFSLPLPSAELPEEIYNSYGLNSPFQKQWREAIAEVGIIRMRLIQYDQVIEEVSLFENLIENSLVNYINDFQLGILENLQNVVNAVVQLRGLLDDSLPPELEQLLHLILEGLSFGEDLQDKVNSLQNTEYISESLLQVTTYMFLIIPYLTDCQAESNTLELE